MTEKNRLLALFESSEVNGIDFVEMVESDPLSLRVHFINNVPIDGEPLAITIDGGDSIPSVEIEPLHPADWTTDFYGRPLLTLRANTSGDFSEYLLTLISAKLDRAYSSKSFSFKVFCPTDFDCGSIDHECPPETRQQPAIDYLAKDFASFNLALRDFSAQRYPNWQERSEADFGVMFMESLSGLADELSYLQDRVAAEATLETASERRSLTAHARLVDYEPAPAKSARALLMLKVTGTSVPAGVGISATDPLGAVISFEIGLGLADATAYEVNPRWNFGTLEPYWWNDDGQCLRCGATEMWIVGYDHGLKRDQALLIETAGETPADPPIRQLIHITDLELATDKVFDKDVTRIVWSESEKLIANHDLARTRIGGNFVPATQGKRVRESFAIGEASAGAATMPLAFARLGANGSSQTPIYRYCLASAPLAWLAGQSSEGVAMPEIQLRQPTSSAADWAYTPAMLNAAEEEQIFTLEPGKWNAVARLKQGRSQVDYDGDDGETLRFGDGTFGVMPSEGDVFEVTYRTGEGARGNVAADTITNVDPVWRGLVIEATNPMAATGGTDRETAAQIKRRAPFAFQSRQYRAVRAQDYEAEAQRLAWVQRAGTTFRWTGSWFSVFTAVDPKGATSLSIDQYLDVTGLLNRRRMAGYESYVPQPRYISIDLKIKVCAEPAAFRGDVERGILARLAPPPRLLGDDTPFFAEDNFTFGTPLERSRIEQAIQAVPGVSGVLAISYRRRGFASTFIDLPDRMTIGNDEILRVANDPSFPERGAFVVHVMGGR